MAYSDRYLNLKIKKFGHVDAYIFCRVESSPGLLLDSSSSSPTNVDLTLPLGYGAGWYTHNLHILIFKGKSGDSPGAKARVR